MIGSGHGGHKSPRKNNRVEVLEFHTAKLKSPMKRSMAELNKIAYENALRNRSVLLDGSDYVEENERSVLNEIINSSKSDGLLPLGMEVEELIGDEKEVHAEVKKELNLTKKIQTVEKKDENIKGTTPTSSATSSPHKMLLNKILFLKNEGEDELSPLKSEFKTPFRSLSPTRSENDSSLELHLRRSPRKRTSVLEKLEDVSNESSPRSKKRNIRNLHSKFNFGDKIIPKNFKHIKLMKVPDIDVHDDELLVTDQKAYRKPLYHDGFEAYFEQNQMRGRISKSSMTMAPEITYEEFNRYNSLLGLICSEPIKSLNQLYEFQFTQWLFELKENFNLIFYGIGSKRSILFRFLQDFVLPLDPKAKCIVINGYNSEFTLRMLLREIWRVCFKKSPPTSREVRETCNFTHLEFMKHSNKSKKLFILLNNIDGESLRNDDLQFMLSQLASIEQISLVCSIDNVNTAVFWDASVLSNYNFIWHNISTFESYSTEVSFKDPLSIGKTDELVGSRGAKYVLSSLTGNAKSLYKNLILQQLDKIDEFIGADTKLLEQRGTITGSNKTCISLREFYELCVSEFIISNDISFRTILGEFVEHKMCTLTRDTSGTEVLYISFTVDELEKLLDEELME